MRSAISFEPVIWLEHGGSITLPPEASEKDATFAALVFALDNKVERPWTIEVTPTLPDSSDASHFGPDE